jgi:flagellar protein FliS
MLFEGAVKAMKKARLFDEQKDRKAYLDELERAQLIVGELLCTLDMEQGELPRQLGAIYSYCLRCLIEASLGDGSRIEEAERHISRIGAAWKDAVVRLRQPGAAATSISGAVA